VYTLPGNFTVTLIVTNPAGCSDTLRKPNLITIGETKADFNTPALVCQGDSFQLKNTSAPQPGSATWDFGDGDLSDSISPVKAFAMPGSYPVKMIANFGACKDSVTRTVQVVAKPTVGFSASSMVSCRAPFTVSFTNTSTGGSNYIWNFGDGSTSADPNPSHTYSREGTFTVTLFAANASGCTDSLVKADLIKIQTPRVSIGGLPQKGCAPLEHTFSANVNSVDSVTGYSWDFGDGTTSLLPSPTHVYHDTGKYTIVLTYTTASGCTFSVKAVNGILVGSKPGTGFNLDPINACADKSISFKDQSTGKPDEWLWFFGDGGSSLLQDPQHVYDDTGYFSVTLISINKGCADTLTLPRAIHINPPVARFTFSQTCSIPKQVVYTDKSIGADLWFWDFGDGTTSAGQSPVHDYAAPGNYTVSLTVTNQTTGCSKTRTEEVRVIKEIAAFATDYPVTCKNSPVTFTATGSDPAHINLYTWRLGDGISMQDSSGSITYSYKKSSSYDVTLILEDINGCFDSLTRPLAVQVNGPTAVFHSGTAGTCIKTPVNFSDSSYTDGTHAILQRKWYWGDGTSDIISGSLPGHSYSAPGTYAVSLKVTDSQGCTDSMNLPRAVIISKPVAAFSGDTLSCTSRSAHFTNTSSGPGLSFTWDFGDGTASNGKSPVHLYAAEGVYPVSLSITDQYGCTSYISKNNFVTIANPQAGFLLSDSVGTCPPLVVTFTNTSVNYSQWKWDFGDGTTSVERNPSHFYSIAGTFTAVLTVTGPGGCTSQKAKNIKVNGPSGSFSYTNFLGCGPLKVNFKATTKKNISFVWDFSDGVTVSTPDSNRMHTYAGPGKYLPKMILEDASGCKVPVMGKDTITVLGVIASFGHSDHLVCDSGLVQFTDSSIANDRIASYLWDFGDGTRSSSPDPQHEYLNPGVYHTSLSLTTLRGCKGFVQNPDPVAISRGPGASITGSNGACVPAVVKLDGSFSNHQLTSVSWHWDFGNGSTSAEQKPPAQQYTSAGKFPVRAIVSGSNGCIDTVVKTVEIYPLPGMIISADTMVCAGSSETLQASGAQSYSWSPATYLSCTHCAAPVARPDYSVTYRVTGTSEHGCISSDSISLSVKHPFKLSHSRPDTLCAGGSVQIEAGGTEKYAWSPAAGLNNPSISSPVASPGSTTTYQVIGSDSKGCFKDTAYVPVKVYPIPVVSAGSDQTINVGHQIEIVPQISGDVTSVLWTPSNGIVSRQYPGITVQPTQTMEYTVEVKNEGKCTASDHVSVFVLCNNANIFVPNTFSPNGDGANDVFYPRGSGVFKINNLRVFNRWGEIVFERSYFNANDISKGWDGTYKGKKLEPDVFVYILDVVCENNTNLVFKGNVALIR
jgi:gliding motility-associated-like protein